MADVARGAYEGIRPAEVPDVDLYHPKSWWTTYVFSQDAKVIAIQYGVTAMGIGLVALVLSWLMRIQLAYPGALAFIDAHFYYQMITMHGMIMVIYLLTALFLGGFGNYLIPLMLGARDMVFPYVNMLSYWIYLLAVLVLVASFFCPGRPDRAPADALSTAVHPRRNARGQEWGIILMLSSLMLFIIGFTMGGLNYVSTVLQGRARGMTLMRMPLTVWGIFTATVMALLAFPALFVGAVMMLFDRLLGTSFFMPSIAEMGEQLKTSGAHAHPVPASLLVLRPPRGLHRRAARFRHRLRSDRHARAAQHLRLSHDGVGHRRHRRLELHRVGASHVRQRHGSRISDSSSPLTHAHHRHSHCDQSL